MKISITILIILLSFALMNCATTFDRQKHFNEMAASSESQPDKVIETLAIDKGWYIGDLGAGGGYYTFRFAEETGTSGKVFAADINQKFLHGIIKKANESGLDNIDTVLASVDDSNFEENSLDLIFIRNTFHHIENKNQYMKNLAFKLKANGQIAIIDYKDSGSFGLFGHSVSREEIVSSLTGSSLVVEHELDFLEKQFFFILTKK